MMLSFLAPAKINLSLAVGPAGPDGRHPLDSLVAFTRTIGDLLTFTNAPTLTLQVNGPFADSLRAETNNLCLRAAHLLSDTMGKHSGAIIGLTKNLPIASGIGGGSADAAATLIGLNKLWNAGLSVKDLQDLGANLGADVPACVAGHPLRMMGTGEVTMGIGGSLPRLGIVLVNPLIACPTGPVYRRFDERGDAIARVPVQLPPLHTQDHLLRYLAQNGNDLEPAARDLVPSIGAVLDAIAASDGVLLTRMSGSGATCFGLYPDKAHAQAGAAEIKNRLAIDPIWVEADELA
jgi:4-diphosphocytidyl-2-C-methyl-D-erythritol kinase